MKFSFANFSRRNLARCIAPDGFNHELSSWSLSAWLVAVAGEFCEALHIAKKLNRLRVGNPGNKRTALELEGDLADELADAMIYLDLAAHSEGIDFPAQLEAAGREWAHIPPRRPLNLSHELVGILAAIGSTAAIVKRMEDQRAMGEVDWHHKAILATTLGEVGRLICRLCTDRGIDPFLAIEARFAATSAKISYREPESLGAGNG